MHWWGLAADMYIPFKLSAPATLGQKAGRADLPRSALAGGGFFVTSQKVVGRQPAFSGVMLLSWAKTLGKRAFTFDLDKIESSFRPWVFEKSRFFFDTCLCFWLRRSCVYYAIRIKALAWQQGPLPEPRFLQPMLRGGQVAAIQHQRPVTEQNRFAEEIEGLDYRGHPLGSAAMSCQQLLRQSLRAYTATIGPLWVACGDDANLASSRWD
jgi:hypothetical protein